MKIDFTRLFLVLIGFVIAQYIISYFLVSIGFNGLPLIITYNLLLGFFAAFVYLPREYKRNAFKEPEFYKNAGIFFVIFLIISIL